MRTFLRPALTSAAVLLASTLVSTTHAALITFSGLNNGINTGTDPDDNTSLTAVPTNYQPLQNAYPTPGGNVDGANIGVSINWGVLKINGNTGDNAGDEHTQSVNSTDSAAVNVFNFAQSGSVSITFSSPVAVPSLWYAYNAYVSGSTTFEGYTNSSDALPAVTFNPSYNPAVRWEDFTSFGATPIEKITITSATGYLQLDDITVNIPEPSAMALMLLGVVLLAGSWTLGKGGARHSGLAVCALRNSIRRSSLPVVLICAAVLLASTLASTTQAALITFSDLHGLATSSQIPSTYQPLLNSYPTPGGNVDGSNIGVSIAWTTSDLVANSADNMGVNDHTHQVNPTDTANVNALAVPHSTFTMTFSAPVNITNLWFAYNSGPSGLNTTFSTYTNPTDITPVNTFSQSYPGGSVNWQEATGFGGFEVEKLTIITDNGNILVGSDGYLQLDDIAVNVPEPATLSLIVIGGLAALGRFGWQRARARHTSRA